MVHLIKSIRTKLTLWYSFILLTTFVAFGLIAYEYLRRQLTDSLDLYLKQEVNRVKTIFSQRIEKTPPPTQEELWNQIFRYSFLNPRKTLIEVTRRDWGSIAFRSENIGDESLMIQEYPEDSIKINTLYSGNVAHLRAAITATKKLQIFVAYPLSELSDVLENVFSIFLILIPVALVISVGGGWLLAYTSLRPVDLITRTAREISAQNLNQKIPERGVDDEIGRLTATFNEMLSRLRHSFDQIKQFSIDASHELRTPLTIMRGEVELALRRQKDVEEYRRVLVSNLEEIVRLSGIVENLLMLAKGDLDQQQLSLEQVNLKELLHELYEDSEVIALKKQINVKLLKNDDVSIMGDKIRLRQLLLNLIDNAIKFTPERGVVSLSCERQNGFAKVEVQDTGIGIPSEEQGKIFDRFYRVDKARSHEVGGSGLGLSIAKWIAELHKGRIEVKSEPSKGSVFSVYLPL